MTLPCVNGCSIAPSSPLGHGPDTIRGSQRKLLLFKRPENLRDQSVDDLERLIVAGKQFGTIYADPPWPYGNQATSAATRNADKREDDGDFITGMETRSHLRAAGCDLAADERIVTMDDERVLREAFDVLEAWGFTYKTAFVWVEARLGICNDWRVGHEFMLLRVAGQRAMDRQEPTELDHETPASTAQSLPRYARSSRRGARYRA